MAEETPTPREGQSKHIEREFEIGKDESWSGNLKRLFDEMLHESLESVRRNRTHVDDVLAESRTHVKNLNQLGLQALSNCVQNCNAQHVNANDTAHLTAKRAIDHSDHAHNKIWNLNETDFVAEAAISKITGSDTFKELIEGAAATAASAVAAAMAKATQSE